MISAYDVDFRSEIGQPEYDFDREGVFIFDHVKVITFWSRGAHCITGFSRAEVENKKFYDALLDPVDKNGKTLDLTEPCFEDLMESGASLIDRAYICHRNGHRVAVSMEFKPVYDDEGNYLSGIGVFCPYEADSALYRRRNRHRAWQRGTLGSRPEMEPRI